MDPMTNRYAQRNALIGLVPLLMLLIGIGVGGTVAVLVGAPEVIGAVAGAMIGFFASRSLLRRSFGRWLYR